jgi:hypothetical protein
MEGKGEKNHGVKQFGEKLSDWNMEVINFFLHPNEKVKWKSCKKINEWLKTWGEGKWMEGEVHDAYALHPY